MNKKSFIFFLSIFLCAALTQAKTVDPQFKKNNPDGYKYEFARSYIAALGYFYNINQRWEKNPPKKMFKGDELKTIRGSIEYFVSDNADLRIVKNYMVKYINHPNSLMRKVTDMLIIACDKDIALNNKEKNLWQDMLNFKSQGKVKPKDEKSFISAQKGIELKRKENDKSIIEASIMMTKILLSQDNPNDKGKMLAITDQQRQKLLNDLDIYGKLVLDWGLKPGQSTLNASVAVIREILEDPIYISHS